MKAYTRYLNILLLSAATLGAVACASEEDPKQKQINTQMTIGEDEMNAGDLKGAYNTFSKAIVADRDNHEAWRMRAEVLIKQNKLKAAMIDLKQAKLIMKKKAEMQDPKVRAQFQDLLAKIKEVEETIKGPKAAEAPALSPSPSAPSAPADSAR